MYDAILNEELADSGPLKLNQASGSRCVGQDDIVSIENDIFDNDIVHPVHVKQIGRASAELNYDLPENPTNRQRVSGIHINLQRGIGSRQQRKGKISRPGVRNQSWERTNDGPGASG
jgi:hypothetical protein